MSLDPSKLRSSLRDIFDWPPTDVGQTGQRWASAYASYSGDAISVLGGSPDGLDEVTPLLAQTFSSIFAVSLSPPPATANAISAALTAYWLLPPVVFSGAFPGVVTAVGGTALMGPALAAAWLKNVATRASNQQAAASIASVIDTFTRLVVVTHASVPPTIGPIS